MIKRLYSFYVFPVMTAIAWLEEVQTRLGKSVLCVMSGALKARETSKTSVI
jgi:hypothetical protein